MDQELIQQVIATIATHADGRRFDSNETALVARDLEVVLSKTYDVKYPEFKGRMLVPLGGGVSPSDETITYNQWDMFGMAKILANYADDLPRVDAFRRQFSTTVVPLGASYSYSVQDLRRSQQVGLGLDQRRAMTARRAVERAIDDIIAFGVDGKIPGLVNHPNVSVVGVTNGDWDGSATADEILEDLHEQVSQIVVDTKETFVPDTLVLDTATFERLGRTFVGQDVRISVLEVFRNTSPHITNITSWYKLNNADAAGTGPRLLLMKRDPEVLELYVPQEFEQFPPQPNGLEFDIPCHARVGGVAIRYPLAMAYIDGVND